MSWRNFKYNISKYWITEISIGTIATILGILLTLGIDSWTEQKAKKQMAERIAMICLHNIDERLDKLEALSRSYLLQDSIFKTMSKMSPSDRRKIDIQTLHTNLSSLFWEDTKVTDQKSEEIFSSSFEVWQYLDNENVVVRLSSSYSYIDAAEQLANRCEDLRMNAINRIYGDVVFAQNTRDFRVLADKILSDKGLAITFYEISKNLPFIDDLILKCRRLNDLNIEEMDFSREDIGRMNDILVDTEYKGWPIYSMPAGGTPCQ